MNIIKAVVALIWSRPQQAATVLPKGTIVHYGGIPCELLEDCKFYSATYPASTEEK